MSTIASTPPATSSPQGLADAERAVITGGSAGGYTVLAALAGSDVFKGGASYYGVSDVAALARDTHKFESRYLDWLIGPYPERADLYRERSPLTHADRLRRPVIFFQGADDRVVPPNQTEMMVEALRRRGIPVGYLLFAGEQHGFRRAENIKRALDAELYFYAELGVPHAAELLNALSHLAKALLHFARQAIVCAQSSPVPAGRLPAWSARNDTWRMYDWND